MTRVLLPHTPSLSLNHKVAQSGGCAKIADYWEAASLFEVRRVCVCVCVCVCVFVCLFVCSRILVFSLCSLYLFLDSPPPPFPLLLSPSLSLSLSSSLVLLIPPPPLSLPH
jgi:hypothetical protein